MCLLFLFYRSEQAPTSGLMRAQLGQCVATLKEQDNSIKKEVPKLSESVFLLKNMDQRTRVSHFSKIVSRCIRY